MSKFEIYVKTSALGQTGIHWRYAKSEEYQPIETPSLIKRQVIQKENGQQVIVNDLIDEVKPSLIILRDEQKLLLEVTGIESPQRSNQLGRIVLNSIVWIADDCKENEVVIRQIAYSAIQSFLQKENPLSEMIQRSISFHGLEEFRVNLKEVNSFVAQLEQVQNQYFRHTEPPQKIQDKSPENLKDLADELRNYHLPKKWSSWNERNKGILVVVTDNLEQQTILHEAGVWRGFANNVEEPVIEVIESSEKKTKTEAAQEILPLQEPQPSPQSNQRSHQFSLFDLILVLIVGIIVILLIFINIKPHQPQPKQILESQEQLEQRNW